MKSILLISENVYENISTELLASGLGSGDSVLTGDDALRSVTVEYGYPMGNTRVNQIYVSHICAP